MFSSLLKQYEATLGPVEDAVAGGTVQDAKIIELFRVRDVIHTHLPTLEAEQSSELDELVALDQRLEHLGPELANATDLRRLAKVFIPDQNAWWWHFERREEKKPFNFLDILWNGLSAAVLAVTASYVVMMVQALSTDGMGLEEVLSTILQGAGLAVLGKGTLTTSGRKNFHAVLNRLHVRQSLHSIAFFSLTASLLAVVAITYHRLDEFFYHRGLDYYSTGQLTEATEAFEHALALEPKNSFVNTALGLVHESLGDMKKAVDEYKIAVEEGQAEGFNDLGHALIHNNDAKQAETYLRMGLQRVYSNSQGKTEKLDLKYKLHRNLGWSLLKQERYDEAQEEFETAIALDRSIPEEQIGGGLAYCLLAHTFELMNESDKAQEPWASCKKHARPETIGEYEWLTGTRKGNFANCIDTNSIVVGIDLQHPANELSICLEKVAGKEN